MISSIIVYAIPFIVCAACHIMQRLLFSKKPKLGKLISVILVCLTLFVICGFKNVTVGRDTIQYLEEYKAAAEMTLSNARYNGFERGYVILTMIFNKLHIPFQGFLMFCYFIIFGCIGFTAYRRSDYPELSIAGIFAIMGPFILSGLRQVIALSICTLALDLFINKKWWWKAIGIAVALSSVLIHSSALLLVVFLPLTLINYKRDYTVIIVPALVLMFFIAPYIYRFIYNFLSTNMYYPIDHSGGGVYVIYTALFAVLALTIKTLNEVEYEDITNSKLSNPVPVKPSEKGLSIAVWATMFLSIFQSFSTINQVFPRYTNYFLPIVFIFGANYLSKIKNAKIRTALIGLVFFGVVAYFYVFYVRVNALDMNPYKFFF